MIRLGGDIAGVLARLGEKTLGMVEGVPIQWMNGASIEQQLHAFETAGQSIFNMVANLSNAKKEGLVQLIAANGKNALTTLQILSSEEVMRITAVATGHGSRTIIDFLTGESSFVQRFSGGSSTFSFNRINFGTGELEFKGGSVAAAGKAITHGLGTKCAGAIPIFSDAGYVPGATSFGETTFEANCQKRDGTSPASGTKAAFVWIAWST